MIVVVNFLQYLRRVVNFIITNIEAQILALVAGTVEKNTIFNICYDQIADMQQTKVSNTGIHELTIMTTYFVLDLHWTLSPTSPGIFYCTLVTNAKGNVAKSNKSELLNRLSYRGLTYHFEVRRKSVRNDCKISRSQPQKFDLDFHSTSTTSKGPTENSKKMSWDNSVFPIDTKNSVVFFVQFFFWVSLDL